MKLFHGIDLVDVGRLRVMLRDSRSVDSFLNLGWTEQEQIYCAGSAERLAARWAAKEATMKALGQGIGPLSLTDIEVVATAAAPRLCLSGAAEARAFQLGINAWVLSLSHESGMALASVIGTAGETP